MAHSVFISYAAPDAVAARAVCEGLERHHIKCWIAPRDILPGTVFTESIIEAIESSQIFVLVLSDHANQSPYVVQEVKKAFDSKITIIAFRVEEVQPSKSLNFFISHYHWVDAFTPPLQKHLDGLAQTVQMLLAKISASGADSSASAAPPVEMPAPSEVTQVPALTPEPARDLPATKEPGRRRFILRKIAPLSLALAMLLAVLAGGYWWQEKIFGTRPQQKAQPEPRATTSPADSSKTREKDFREHLARGKEFLDSREYQKAITQFALALQINPDDASPYYERGQAYYHNGELDQAIADFSRALKIAPRHASAYNYRGLAYRKKGLVELAIQDYTKALEINPRFLTASYNRGIAYVVSGKEELAIQDFTLVLEIDPKYAEAYHYRGLAYEKRGLFDEALNDYTKTLELKPRYAEAYYSRGLVYWKKGQDKPALKDYSQAIEINPGQADYYNNRGLVYWKMGQTDLALKDYTRALELKPKFAEAHFNAGLAYGKKGRYKQAIQAFSQAIEVNPKYGRAYYSRGIAHALVRSYDQAWDDIRKAQSLGAQVDPKVLENLRKISGRNR